MNNGLTNALKTVKDALLAVGVPVSHYRAAKQPDKYIVWSEDNSPKAAWGDDGCTFQIIEGTVHYFTRTEFDVNVEKIQLELSGAEIVWRYNSIQYEDDTGYIHHEWIWKAGV